MADETPTVNLTDLESSIFKGIDQLELLRFDKSIYRDQVFVGLDISLLERCHSILVLVREGKVFDAKIILRSAFEHLIEAKNIVDNSEFHWNSQADFFKGMRIKLTSANDGNPYLTSIATSFPIAEELDGIAVKTAKISEMGGKNLSFETKCHSVGMQAEYDAIYRSLSNQVHPTYAGIIERHFKINHKAGDFDVRGFEPADKLTWELVVDTTRQIVVHSLALIENFDNEN